MYFPDEEPGLSALLDGFLAALAEDFRKQAFQPGVRALLLAGGYGRGEGGIFREAEDAAPRLYNDLEFYLIAGDGVPAGPIEEWCARQSHEGDARLGIEVEFKILREGAFRTAEPSMFYYDLLARHRVVHAEAGFIESLPERLRKPALIPGHEAARLLFNRGTGLFFSWAALKAGSVRVGDGFIERNHAKVRLALADAVLAFQGRYHFSCVTREKRLAEAGGPTPPGWATLVGWHTAGVRFKLHPRHLRPPPADLEDAQEELSRVWMSTFLWVESQRLGSEFGTAAAYARHPGRLFPRKRPWRNLALHLRDKVKRGSALPGAFDYPRAALQRALVCVLAAEPDTALAGECLGLGRNADLGQIEKTYERWWRWYN